MLPPDDYEVDTSPLCQCNMHGKELTVSTNKNGNKGKKFYACNNDRSCNFFEWSEAWRTKQFNEKLVLEAEAASGEVLTIRRKKGQFSSPEKNRVGPIVSASYKMNNPPPSLKEVEPLLANAVSYCFEFQLNLSFRLIVSPHPMPAPPPQSMSTEFNWSRVYFSPELNSDVCLTVTTDYVPGSLCETRLGFVTPLLKDEGRACIFSVKLTDGVVEAHRRALEIEASAGTFAKLFARALNEDVVGLEVLEDGAGFPELRAVLRYASLSDEGAEIRLKCDGGEDGIISMR